MRCWISSRTQGRSFTLCLAIVVGLCCEQPFALATNNDSQPSTAIAGASFANITTLEGKTYEQVTIQKIQPDGLLVDFKFANGGLGTAKLKFKNLPEAIRERFGYDAQKAEAFEASQAEGQKLWNAQYEVWAERRQAALAEQSAQEERRRDQARANEAARLAAAEARAARESQTQVHYAYPYAYGYGHGWGWPTSWNGHQHHHKHRSRGAHPLPEPGQIPSKVSPFMAPMRPLGK